MPSPPGTQPTAPSRQHRRRENHGPGGEAGLGHHGPRFVRLKVPIRGVVGLPNPAEVGFAGDAGQSVLGCGGSRS